MKGAVYEGFVCDDNRCECDDDDLEYFDDYPFVCDVSENFIGGDYNDLL